VSTHFLHLDPKAWQRMHAYKTGSKPMPDDVRSDLSEIAAVDLSKAAKLVDSSEWYVRQLIKQGKLQSFMDGRKRKVTLRSIKERQERLLKAQNAPPTIPPVPRRSRSSKPQRASVAMTAP
jgi:hypothetical protein